VSASDTLDPTGPTRDRRRLVAILYADMVGYSRLTSPARIVSDTDLHCRQTDSWNGVADHDA
jgi:hypothetical protein